MNNITPDPNILGWELEVSPEPIESGQPFAATLGGTALFTEDFLDDAQPFFPGGLKEIDLVDLKATVQVRSGATGPDVVLKVEDTVPYTCRSAGSTCNPTNYLPSVPGLRGNTDCKPEGPTNPCGRFYLLPISSDCLPGGVCADRDKTGPDSQCENNGFCITGDLRFRLQDATGHYTADDEGKVFFGWDDENTGAELDQTGGPNHGTWILPALYNEKDPLGHEGYERPRGPIGFRLTVGGLPAAMECTMGVDSQGPLGVDSFDALSSPTPSEALISFPIETDLL